MLIIKLTAIFALLQVTFAAKVFHHSSPNGPYQYSYWDAHKACKDIGAHLATAAELEEVRRTNYSMCACGWTLDKTAHFPMTVAMPGCGNAPGLHLCDWRASFDAYCFTGDAIGNCSAALGVESGGIHYSQMYASSEFRSWFPIFRSSLWSAQIARLHNKDLINAWIPGNNGRKQWLEVDLNEPTAVTGIVTQGASRLGTKMWVTSFQIKYSKDGHNYKTIQDDGKNKLFAGNVNNDGLKRNMFPEPVLARYIQFIPVEYHNRIALRLELLGCDMNTFEAGQARGRDMEVFQGKIPEDNVFSEIEPDKK